MAPGPLKVFYSYAHEDTALRDKLAQHLELLQRQGAIVAWHDREIVPGREWRGAIEENLSAADIVLLLISRACLDSDFVREHEIPLAMEAHERGQATIVPVILEPVGPLDKQPFGKLEALPTMARPVSEWPDTTEALRNVAEGLKRIAVDIVNARGGPFEFGPRQFTEAELSGLRPPERARATAGLSRLFDQLVAEVPARRVDGNLLVATWSLRRFGREPAAAPDSDFYVAEVLSAFDIVAVQEIDRDLGRMYRVLDLLGPDWSFLISDVAPGKWGNRERTGIVYYAPRVRFMNISGQVVLTRKELIDGEQLARPPLQALFAAGGFEFRLCSTHLKWGSNPEDRLREVAALASHLAGDARSASLNVIVAGELTRGTLDGPALAPWQEKGFVVPAGSPRPTNSARTRQFDAILLRLDRDPVPDDVTFASGAVDYYRSVLREADEQAFIGETGPPRAERRPPYGRWRTLEMSDHLPLWLELDARHVPSLAS